jgi:hypothetical protein
MKKAIVLTLAAVFFLSAFLPLPGAAPDDTAADKCHDSWEACRDRSLNSDDGWFRVAVMLTVCDLALGKCLLWN